MFVEPNNVWSVIRAIPDISTLPDPNWLGTNDVVGFIATAEPIWLVPTAPVNLVYQVRAVYLDASNQPIIVDEPTDPGPPSPQPPTISAQVVEVVQPGTNPITANPFLMRVSGNFDLEGTQFIQGGTANERAQVGLQINEVLDIPAEAVSALILFRTA